MHRGVVKIFAMLVASACLGCPSGEGGEDYARRQAELAEKNLLGKAVKVETTLPSGVQVPCNTLLDAEQLTSKLGESKPLAIADHSEKSPDSTSTCSIRRGGKPLDEKTQEKMLESNTRLGVLGGDELCNVTLYCSIPADQEGLESRCKSEGNHGNEALGVYACVRVTPRGEKDGYTYRFIDPDTQCTLRVTGGPGVVEESVVQSCARAVMELVTLETIKS